MRSEWSTYFLSDVINIIGGGTPKRSVDEYWNGDIPWLSVKDFNNDRRYVDSAEESITEIGLSNSSTKILDTSQLIISARGTVGALAQVGRPMAFNQSCYGIDGKTNLVINDFLYYLMRYTVENLQRITHGAIFDTITMETFKQVQVSLPPIPEQKAIAHILGTLDDKIELNRKMNETLESIARTIFKSWFVDFEPIRAKAEGRQPVSIDSKTAALFPDSFEESELGMIPKGWRLAKVSEMAFIDRGISYKGEYLSEDGLPMINLGCFLGKGLFRRNKIKGYGGEYKQRHIVEPGDLLLANTDMTQKRVILGSPIIISQIGSNKVYLFSHHVYAVRLLEGISHHIRRFLFYSFLQDTFRERAEGFATGTTVLAMPKEAVLSYSIVLPEEILLNRAFDILAPIHERMICNDEENDVVAQVRDSLLPRLLSGATRVNYADKFIENFL